MAAKYTNATPETYLQLKDLIAEHAEELDAVGVRFDIIMAYAAVNEQGEKVGTALKLHGYPCNGLVSIVSLKNRVMGRADAEIILDGDRWMDLEEAQQKALLHHEMHHVLVARDVEGGVIHDSHGRPKLKMRLHDVDVGWFHHIAKIHGDASAEVTQARQIVREHGPTFFPFMREIPSRPKQKKLK